MNGTVIALALGLAALSAPAAQAQSQVLVSATGAGALPVGARPVAQLAPGLGTFELTVPRGLTPEAYARRLEQRAGVLAAQPNWHLKRSTGLFNVCVDAPKQPQDSLAITTGAAALTPPATAAPIAVLDTGVEAGVPALAGRVLATSDVTTGGDAPGDSDGHGTQVAAVAAGASELFRGISPTSQVLPVRIYTRNGDTSAVWVVKAIQAAVKRGAKVINISGSNPRADLEEADVRVVEQAIAAAYAQGVITVVAAGNEGKGDLTVPGSLPHVLNVGSASADGQRDSFSNFGPFIDLVSPGAELTVPVGGNVCPSGFGRANGTSFSAPAVAGATAFLRTALPKLSTQQLFDLVRESATRDLSSAGRDDDTGFGMLDLSSGLNAATPANEPRELDDDVFWLKGIYAKKHTPLVKRTRFTRVRGRVSALKDPRDVFPVDLRKGERLTVTAKTSPASAFVDMGIWKGGTGAFDIGLGKDANLLADPGGLSTTPRVSYRAKRKGRVYLSVEAPDVPSPATPRRRRTSRPSSSSRTR